MLNADLGERGYPHPVDDRLMGFVSIANLACGGHAGDTESIAYYRRLAKKYHVRISAHLSFPDRAHFGRRVLLLSRAALWKSLDRQFKLLPVPWVKFHGALYHQAHRDSALARTLVEWLSQNSVTHLFAMPNTLLAKRAAEVGLAILAEVFGERRYRFWRGSALSLVSRSEPGAQITNLAEALAQCRLLNKGRVEALSSKGVVRRFVLRGETLCIHSDSPLALALAEKLGKNRG